MITSMGIPFCFDVAVGGNGLKQQAQHTHAVSTGVGWHQAPAGELLARRGAEEG
jgi:hypothetical protein